MEELVTWSLEKLFDKMFFKKIKKKTVYVQLYKWRLFPQNLPGFILIVSRRTYVCTYIYKSIEVANSEQQQQKLRNLTAALH